MANGAQAAGFGIGEAWRTAKNPAGETAGGYIYFANGGHTGRDSGKRNIGIFVIWVPPLRRRKIRAAFV